MHYLLFCSAPALFFWKTKHQQSLEYIPLIFWRSYAVVPKNNFRIIFGWRSGKFKSIETHWKISNSCRKEGTCYLFKNRIFGPLLEYAEEQRLHSHRCSKSSYILQLYVLENDKYYLEGPYTWRSLWNEENDCLATSGLVLVASACSLWEWPHLDYVLYKGSFASYAAPSARIVPWFVSLLFNSFGRLC